MVYLKVAKRVDPKSSHRKEKNCFLFLGIYMRWWLLTKLFVVIISQYTYIYVSQVIMLYTLTLYSAICQLYFSKTEKKKAEKEVRECLFYFIFIIIFLINLFIFGWVGSSLLHVGFL